MKKIIIFVFCTIVLSGCGSTKSQKIDEMTGTQKSIYEQAKELPEDCLVARTECNTRDLVGGVITQVGCTEKTIRCTEYAKSISEARKLKCENKLINGKSYKRNVENLKCEPKN